MSARPSLLRSTLTFSGATFVSRILGLVREQAIAYAFGANAATDAFWVAFRIPNFLRRLFAEGSFSVAFVPVFTEVKEKRSHEDLKQLVARTAGTLGGVLMLVTALGVLGAGVVAKGFAPGSIDEPAKLALTTEGASDRAVVGSGGRGDHRCAAFGADDRHQVLLPLQAGVVDDAARHRVAQIGQFGFGALDPQRRQRRPYG